MIFDPPNLAKSPLRSDSIKILTKGLLHYSRKGVRMPKFRNFYRTSPEISTFFSLFSYSVSWQGRRGPFPWLEDCECKRARPPRCHYCVMLVNRSLCAGIIKLFLLVTPFFLLKNRNCTYFVFLICIDNWCCWLRQCPKGTVCRKRYQRVSLCGNMPF